LVVAVVAAVESGLDRNITLPAITAEEERLLRGLVAGRCAKPVPDERRTAQSQAGGVAAALA
jgi:hypothetical protein